MFRILKQLFSNKRILLTNEQHQILEQLGWHINICEVGHLPKSEPIDYTQILLHRKSKDGTPLKGEDVKLYPFHYNQYNLEQEDINLEFKALIRKGQKSSTGSYRLFHIKRTNPRGTETFINKNEAVERLLEIAKEIADKKMS